MSNNKNNMLIYSLDLPQFNNMNELSEITRLSPSLLFCLSRRTDKYYSYKKISKKNGEQRTICIPSYTLCIVQRWILKEILDKILPTSRAMAFRKGSEYGHKQNAIYHSRTLYGLKLDLKDFFPSISSNKVYTVFSNLGYNRFAATILTNLCTLNGKLPQGSPSSPALSNLICISLDKRFIGLCEKHGIHYSRYADDMYFSCDNKDLLFRIFPFVCKIIENEGFILNKNKIQFQTPSNKKQITGITVCMNKNNDFFELKAPKELKSKIREEIYICLISGNYEKRDHILGEIAYVNYIEKENSQPYIERIKNYINKQLVKLEYFPELVNAYNENKFFDDLSDAYLGEININNEEDFYDFASLFQNRKKFLIKKDINDICQYSNWPNSIINTTREDTDSSLSNIF